jgi:electron transfer flavoprotein alpha/beta subunit
MTLTAIWISVLTAVTMGGQPIVATVLNDNKQPQVFQTKEECDAAVKHLVENKPRHIFYVQGMCAPLPDVEAALKQQQQQAPQQEKKWDQQS